MRYNLPTITLGRTGLVITRLGIGGAYCETPEGYRAALDCGVNYLDTARAYRDGQDEQVVGEAIKDRRKGIILATKTATRDAKGAQQDLEKSLRLLQTDYIDIWQIHYVNKEEELERTLGPGGALETAIKAREKGHVRFIGITGHKWSILHQALATGTFDTVLCWYNCAMREAEELVFPEAQRCHTGVVIMNASRNDKLFDGLNAPPEADFYRYVLGHPAVHATLVGLRDINRFRRIAAALATNCTLPEASRRVLESYGAWMRASGKLDIEE